MKITSCRSEDELTNNTKYVIIELILTILFIFEHTNAGAHRNREMPNYLLFTQISKEVSFFPFFLSG